MIETMIETSPETGEFGKALNREGIYFAQMPSAGTGAVQITTRLEHGGSGQFLQSTHTIPVSRNDAQGIGSAITYGKRQAAAAILGLAARGEDDDGEGAVGRGSAKPPLPPAEPERPSLATRLDRLEKTLNEVKLLRDLDRAWKLGADLMAEAREKDPERAARLDALHEKRHVELLGGAG